MKKLGLCALAALAGLLAHGRPAAAWTVAIPGRLFEQVQKAQPAAGNEAAQCVVTEILATNEKKGVDPKLDKFRSKLSKKPFTAWGDTFKLLGEQTLATEHNKPAATKLVNGGITLLFKDRMAAHGGKTRLRFSIDVDGKDGKRTLSTIVVFDSGEQLFPTAGENYQGGTYFLALTCTAQ